MVLDTYRELADRVLVPLARPLRTVNPDALSWTALLSALGAGIAIVVVGGGWALSFAAVLVVLSALFDALDGKVAKETGRASVRGDFLDHTLDRYADVFVLGGIALSPYCPPALGLLAVLGVLLTSYMGTQAQALGLGREYGGILGRADRLVILIAAIALQAAFDPSGQVFLGIPPAASTVLGWAMVVIAVLGNLTAVQRAARIWRRLSTK